MLFNSLEFALFLPIVTGVYYLLRYRGQNLWLLAASLFFYASWDWRFLPILATTMVVDFYVAAYLEKLAKSGAPESKRKLVLAISMGSNLAMLGFFKYFNFFADSLHSGLLALHIPAPISTLNILLPIGISFYTFQSMSYTIDVYRGELPAAKHFLDFALFVSFYPHLVAGPIMRAVDLLPQIESPRHASREQILDGIQLIVWGLWKKMFIADNLAPVVNRIFAETAPSGFHTLIGVYAFAFQIYCDFSGYSSIAIGLARILGFDFGINFDRPYFSRSFSEFWSRWHISLSSWLRDYLYVSLGGNRGGKWRTYRNLMITMLLGGLWHGASWTFVFWGALHGAYLVVERMLSIRIPRALQLLLVFNLTCFAWVFFRAHSFANAWQVLSGIASMHGSIADVDDRWRILKCALMIAVMLAFEMFPKREPTPAMRLAFVASCVWVVLIFGTFSGNNFIYFQF